MAGNGASPAHLKKLIRGAQVVVRPRDPNMHPSDTEPLARLETAPRKLWPMYCIVKARACDAGAWSLKFRSSRSRVPRKCDGGLPEACTRGHRRHVGQVGCQRHLWRGILFLPADAYGGDGRSSRAAKGGPPRVPGQLHAGQKPDGQPGSGPPHLGRPAPGCSGPCRPQLLEETGKQLGRLRRGAGAVHAGHHPAQHLCPTAPVSQVPEQGWRGATSPC